MVNRILARWQRQHLQLPGSRRRLAQASEVCALKRCEAAPLGRFPNGNCGEIRSVRRGRWDHIYAILDDVCELLHRRKRGCSIKSPVNSEIELTGEGADLIFDGVGEANVWRSFQALRPGGRVIAYGFTSFLQKGQLASGLRYRLRGILRPAGYALRAFLSPGRRRILPYSIQYLKRWKPGWFREDLSALLDMLRDKKIKPMVAERIPLNEARRAQELLGQGSVRGKLVLMCNSPLS